MKKVHVELKDTYKGYTFVVVFHHLGFRNGYIELKNESQLNTPIESVEITYDNRVPQYHEELSLSKDSIVIGFDCGHSHQGQDYDQAYAYGLMGKHDYALITEINKNLSIEQPHVVTKDEVAFLCLQIIDELEEDHND